MVFSFFLAPGAGLRASLDPPSQALQAPKSLSNTAIPVKILGTSTLKASEPDISGPQALLNARITLFVVPMPHIINLWVIHMIKSLRLAAGLLIGLCAQAQAVPIVFTFDDSQPNANVISLSESGLGLTVRAIANAGAPPTQGTIATTPGGWGVLSEPGGGPNGELIARDGTEREALRLIFDMPVKIERILFFEFSNTVEGFTIATTPPLGAPVVVGISAIENGPGPSLVLRDLSGSATLTGSGFALRALSNTDFGQNGILLSAIEVSIVPLPPALALTGASLLSLGLWGRRRRA